MPSRCFGLQFGQRAAQCLGLVGADPFDEMHQRGLAATGVRGLVERVDHQAGDELVAAVGGGVAVGTVVAVLDDEVLLRQPLQHGHDRRVGQVAPRRQRLVHLAHGLGFAHGPQVVHHLAFELPESHQLGHVSFTLLSNEFRVLRAYYRVSYPNRARGFAARVARTTGRSGPVSSSL